MRTLSIPEKMSRLVSSSIFKMAIFSSGIESLRVRSLFFSIFSNWYCPNEVSISILATLNLMSICPSIYDPPDCDFMIFFSHRSLINGKSVLAASSILDLGTTCSLSIGITSVSSVTVPVRVISGVTGSGVTAAGDSSVASGIISLLPVDVASMTSGTIASLSGSGSTVGSDSGISHTGISRGTSSTGVASTISGDVSTASSSA